MPESRKIQYSKRVLSDTLIQLLKEKPFSKITVVELCSRADVNRTTFYNHYRDVIGLLEEIEEKLLLAVQAVLDALLEKNRGQDPVAIMEGMFVMLKQNRGYLEVLMSDSGNIDFQNRLIGAIYEKTGVTLSDSIQGEDEKYVYVINGSIALIRLWIKHNFSTSAKRMASTMYALAMKVLG